MDYLIHVKGMDFVPAVQLLCEKLTPVLPEQPRPVEAPAPTLFALPEKNDNSFIVTAYLMRRGIDFNVIARCMENGTLYESKGHHNAVFVGMDEAGVPRYAMLRGTDGGSFKVEAAGSDKRFAFSMRGTSDTLLVAESAIDALSVATILRGSGKEWRVPHYLSLGGISEKQTTVPRALEQYLSEHPDILHIRLMLDNDRAGRGAAQRIIELLGDRYEVRGIFPAHGKDYNDEARWQAANSVVKRDDKEK